jgi:transcriptional regulator with XRE-family HTH domain
MSTDNSAKGEQLGPRIKRLRLERGLSQDRLAIEAHVDQSGLSKFERERDRSISVAALRRIAGILRVPFEELVAGTEFDHL